jgi:hypothetical protein
MALSYSTTGIRNPMLNVINTFVGASALLRIYDGVKPAAGGAATTLLAELACDSTSFAATAAGGALTANTISQDPAGNATGQATWFRVVSAAGLYAIDGTVGSSTGASGDLMLSSVTVSAGQPVSVSSFVITEGNP